jgi:hypothetical protein
MVDGNSLTLADNTLHAYVVYIAARCTGGVGGNSGLGAMFKIEVSGKAAAGVASILLTPIITTIANERNGVWDVDVAVTSNKIQFNVVGDTNDNIIWTGWVNETTIS